MATRYARFTDRYRLPGRRVAGSGRAIGTRRGSAREQRRCASRAVVENSAGVRRCRERAEERYTRCGATRMLLQRQAVVQQKAPVGVLRVAKRCGCERQREVKSALSSRVLRARGRCARARCCARARPFGLPWGRVLGQSLRDLECAEA